MNVDPVLVFMNVSVVITFSREPSSLLDPFKHFFSFPVSTLYTLGTDRTLRAALTQTDVGWFRFYLTFRS